MSDARSLEDRFRKAAETAAAGGAEKYHQKLAEQGKLFVRDRVDLLVDPGSFREDGLLANASAGDLAADGVVTGRATVDGRPVVVIANDPTVKAGSWGARTVEKMIRMLEAAYDELLPVFYLVDSAGARITDQVDLFPGRRGAGRIFYSQVRLSGRVPQICCLFGPSAAGGAYIPSFCDVVIMVEGRASMYLGSPRMAQMVIGEHTSLEEMGGARMHCEVSGCGDALVTSDEEAIDWAKLYFSYVAEHYRVLPPEYSAEPAAPGDPGEILPADSTQGYDMVRFLERVVDEDSLFQVKELYAREVITAFARLEGKPVGIVASQPSHLGGVLFVDSADKASRFIWLCDAFNLPLLFFADVPGFMIGTQVERQGIIRSGAKMLTAIAEATVPAHLGDRPQGVRCGPLRVLRAGPAPRGDAGAPHRRDRRHGSRGGGQRRLLQQDPGAPRRPAGRVRRRTSCRVPRGRRPAQARLRAGGRCRGPAFRPSRRARPAARRRRPQGASLLRPASRRSPGMTDPTEGGEQPDPLSGEPPAEEETAPEEERWPIGFILTIVMAGLYLAYRLWQGLVLVWRSVF